MKARFDEDRLSQAWRLVDRWVETDQVPAASVAVGGARSDIVQHHAGRQWLDRPQPLDPNAIFLIASPTKPITALAVMMLAEAGELSLADPVARYLPEFGNGGKQAITLAHCLTHTSGLPDMLPNNTELRKQNAPLSEFVAGVCRLSPLFEPGTAVKYQSMGILMLAEVVRRVAGMPLAEFLEQRIFQPLDMHDTARGMPPAWVEQGRKATIRAASGLPNCACRPNRLAAAGVGTATIGVRWAPRGADCCRRPPTWPGFVAICCKFMPATRESSAVRLWKP